MYGLESLTVEAATGFEPVNNGFADRCLSHLAMPPIKIWSGKRDLNPRQSRWQREALPLSYSRSISPYITASGEFVNKKLLLSGILNHCSVCFRRGSRAPCLIGKCTARSSSFILKDLLPKTVAPGTFTDILRAKARKPPPLPNPPELPLRVPCPPVYSSCLLLSH